MVDLAAATFDGAGQRRQSGAQRRVGGVFVLPGQARIAGHIGIEDGRQLALDRLIGHSLPKGNSIGRYSKTS
jgi:UDP-3-O-[3-hydroxymyristoyl] glucosamine N-acyltransferase